MRHASLTAALVLLPVGLSAASQDEAAQLALDVVARQTGGGPSSIVIESTERAEWPDASLGCGTLTEDLTPQVTRGYRVLLRAAGKLHVVHVAGDKVVLCARGLTQASAPREVATMQGNVDPAPSDPASLALVAKARDDLARRLSIAPDQITLVAFKAVVWPDSSLGCPRPGMVYTQVQREGMLIRLEARGRRFDYHGGSGRDPFLCEHPSAPLPGVQ